jgi:tRNA-specific 2-thiouridylase
VVAAEDGSLKVMLGKPVKAVTPGQAAVFYDGDRVLGRGFIDSVG